MAETQTNNYVVGRGRVYFDRMKDGSKQLTGERYFGNTPEFSLSMSSTDLDHYSSESGVKEKDASITLTQDTSGTIVCDNISAENLALWFLGESLNTIVGAAVGETQQARVQRGTYIQLGTSEAMPQGHGDVDNVTISNTGATAATGVYTLTANPAANDTVTINGVVITYKAGGAGVHEVNIGAAFADTATNLKNYINAHSDELAVTAASAGGVVTVTSIAGGVAGNAITTTETGANSSWGAATLAGGAAGDVPAANNWEVDLGTGRVYILPDAANIDDDDLLTITYDTGAHTVEQTISQGRSIFGAVRFISDNPVGSQRDYFFPYAKLTPDGDYALKGDDWQSMSFSLDILRRDSNTERVYSAKRN